LREISSTGTSGRWSELNCKNAIKEISDYLDRELDPWSPTTGPGTSAMQGCTIIVSQPSYRGTLLRREMVPLPSK